MFKVEFENGMRRDMYIEADGFHTYDECLTFFNVVRGLNRGFGDALENTANVAAVRGLWSSVTKVDGQPFDPSQSGDTEDDI